VRERRARTHPASRGRPAIIIVGRADIALLDRVTTLEAIVPDPSERSLYARNEAITEGAQRSYTFGLKSQVTTDPARHFQIISVAWARPGSSASDRPGESGLSGTGGPNGAFVEKVSRMPDGMLRGASR
jgi:hypothetical protein